MSVLLEVSVARSFSDAVSDALFEVGFTGLQLEELSADRVALLTSAETEAETRRLALGLEQLCETRSLPVTLSYRTLDDAWRLLWTEHLEPVVVSPRLTLVPSAPPQPRVSTELYLGKALAFGFGEHPTTLMALRWLDGRALGKRLLDVGAGTGVLALAAAHFGATCCLGTDIDAESVQAATINAEQNGFARLCTFQGPELDGLPSDFDVVTANLDVQTLARLAAQICARMRTGAQIALTGLLDEQRPQLEPVYARQGVELGLHDQSGDWVLLVGTKAAR